MQRLGLGCALGAVVALTSLSGCGRSNQNSPSSQAAAGAAGESDGGGSTNGGVSADDGGASPKGGSSEPALPVICDPGARTCNGPDVELCGDDGTKLAKETTCGLTQVCVGGACHDIQCVPNRKLCRDNQIWSCSSDGLGAQLVRACKADQFCLEDDGDASCSATVCTPNDALCVGEVATKCKPDGSGPAAGGQDCKTAEQLCYEGECRDQACTPGQKLCDHGDVYLCAEAGTSEVLFTDCAENEACDAASGACRPQICEPGKHGCDGNRITVCNQLGTAWDSETDCTTDNARCDEGSCKPKICSPYFTFCKDGDVYKCDSLGISASLYSVCQAQEHCGIDFVGQGLCKYDECNPGELTCLNGYLANCNADGSGQVEGGTFCPDGQICSEDAKSCTPAVCAPYQSFCNDGDVYYCQNGLKQVLSEDCGDSRYCKAEGQWTHCVPYDCLPNSNACLGNKLGKCSADGLSLTNVSEDCAATAKVCNSQLSCTASSVDILGSSKQLESEQSGQLVGDFVKVLSARKLTKIEIKLSLPAARDLLFQIYEVSDNGALTFLEEHLVADQVGEGYFSSPPLDLSLKPNTSYFLGAAATGGSFAAPFDTDPWLTEMSLGRAEGGRALSAFPYRPSDATAGPFLYLERLATEAP